MHALLCWLQYDLIIPVEFLTLTLKTKWTEANCPFIKILMCSNIYVHRHSHTHTHTHAHTHTHTHTQTHTYMHTHTHTHTHAHTCTHTHTHTHKHTHISYYWNHIVMLQFLAFNFKKQMIRSLFVQILMSSTIYKYIFYHVTKTTL